MSYCADKSYALRIVHMSHDLKLLTIVKMWRKQNIIEL